MFSFLKKDKIKTTVFVVTSLTVFLIFLVLYLAVVVVNSNKHQIEKFSEYLTMDLSEKSKTSDPFVTRVPQPEDFITEPIISDNDPSLGVDSSSVTVVEFADFECSFCKKQEEVIKKVISGYGDKVKFIWKDYPESVNSISFFAAVAARCADDQGEFWKYHDLLFENNEKLNNDLFVSIAQDINLDIPIFTECLDGDNAKQKVLNNIFEANALNITGIPFLYINNREIMGEISEEELNLLIKIELEE